MEHPTSRDEEKRRAGGHLAGRWACRMERQTYSDPEASWGHRSAVSTRKGGGFYGYRIHAAVCTKTGLPLAWRVRRPAITSPTTPPRYPTRYGLAASPH
jgi:hypothetical protein